MSDLYHFEITTNSTKLEDQLAIDWGFGAKFLAKRMRFALGKLEGEAAICALREALRERDPKARRGALLNRTAKAQPWEHETITTALGMKSIGAKKASAEVLAAMEQGLAALSGQALNTLLTGRWLLQHSGSINNELWLLHALLHEIEPDTIPAPKTTRLSLAVKAIHPDVKMPLARSYGVENLALRLLGFLELGGPIDAMVVGGNNIKRPLTVPLVATLKDWKPRSGTIHLLLPNEVAERYTTGIVACSTAWG
jgi:hypothetical protein